jgi:formylglycine-generating enzyme required for sulfatase activity
MPAQRTALAPTRARPLAQTGRADLLRALHLGLTGALALEHTDSAWWGYVPPAADAAYASVGEILGGLQLPRLDPEPLPTASRATARSALRMPEVWHALRMDAAEADEAHAGDSEDDRDPDDATARARLRRIGDILPSDDVQVSYQDLMPWARLVRPLARALRQPQSGAVDVAALLRASARRRWPQHMPRRARHVWPSELVVLLDFSPQLFPYWHDMHRVVAGLQGFVPRAQLRVRIGEQGPFGAWLAYTCGKAGPRSAPEAHPQPGRTYLVLSDLGLLRPTPELAQAWQAWFARAQARQCACVALAPVAADDIGAELAATVRLLRWSPDSRLLAERGRPSREQADAYAHVAGGNDAALDELLGCLAAVLRMDPPLLRALRQHGSAPGDASLEGRLWAHPDVRATNYASLRRGRREAMLAAPNAAAPWAALHELAALHHAHWALDMRVVDAARQLAALPVPPPKLLEDARADVYRLAESVRTVQDGHAELSAIAEYVLADVHDKAKSMLRPALDALAQAIGRPTGPRCRWCLLQRGEDLYVAPAGDARPPGPGVVLCGDIGQASPGELIRIAQPQRLPSYLTLPAECMLRLPVLLPGSVVTLGGVETELTRQRRTRGVWGWWHGDEGLIERLDLPWSKDLSFPNEGLTRGFALLPSQNGGEVRVGVDRDEYGLFLELVPLMERGVVFPPMPPLRFRYLEPATFLQGSREGSGDDDEHPQHPVTLTQGLWLAESPCTQALWQAVMGKNPSYFQTGEDAPRRPVENVTWHDVMAFLTELHSLLPPGCEAVLPTESQWEYACRAGTQTEYWWGDDPDLGKANIDTEGSKSWEGKDGTTPVGCYPPNPWGLYDMHGNVWEWCADNQREYSAEPARDPGGRGGRYGFVLIGRNNGIVVRGGSWFYRSNDARAACRLGRPSENANQNQGFRFALRSSSGPHAPAAEALRRTWRTRVPPKKNKDSSR